MANYQEYYRQSIAWLNQKNIHNAAFLAKHIIAHYSGVAHQQRIIGDAKINDAVVKQCNDAYQRLIAGESLARIIGSAYFYGNEFIINEYVLEPRVDSEVLVGYACGLYAKHQPLRIFELGVGSGCLMISLLKYYEHAIGDGGDISDDAIKIAHENAQRLGVTDRFNSILGDKFTHVPKNLQYDMIISNPPYIPRDDIMGLDINVRDYDPHIALDGGVDGLDFYRYLAENADNYMVDSGYLIMECGYDQGNDIKAILQQYPYWQNIQILFDNGNRQRVVVGRCKKG